jgi:hypothetical protein
VHSKLHHRTMIISPGQRVSHKRSHHGSHDAGETPRPAVPVGVYRDRTSGTWYFKAKRTSPSTSGVDRPEHRSSRKRAVSPRQRLVGPHLKTAPGQIDTRCKWLSFSFGLVDLETPVRSGWLRTAVVRPQQTRRIAACYLHERSVATVRKICSRRSTTNMCPWPGHSCNRDPGILAA